MGTTATVTITNTCTDTSRATSKLGDFGILHEGGAKMTAKSALFRCTNTFKGGEEEIQTEDRTHPLPLLSHLAADVEILAEQAKLQHVNCCTQRNKKGKRRWKDAKASGPGGKFEWLR